LLVLVPLIFIVVAVVVATDVVVVGSCGV